MASSSSTHSSTLTLDREDLCTRVLALLPAKRARLRRAIDEVTAENSASAADGPLPSDPTMLLLSEISQNLEGSILTADRRRAVLIRAESLGIRPFDASLLIAVAQDRARRGESLKGAPNTLQSTILQEQSASGPLIALWMGALSVGVILALLGGSWLLS